MGLHVKLFQDRHAPPALPPQSLKIDFAQPEILARPFTGRIRSNRQIREEISFFELILPFARWFMLIGELLIAFSN